MNIYLIFARMQALPNGFPVYSFYRIIETTMEDWRNGKFDSEMMAWSSNYMNFPGSYTVLVVERHANIAILKEEVKKLKGVQE